MDLLLSLLALLFAPSSPLFLPVWCSLMDANGHLLNWISSQDGDKRGTAFFSHTPSLLLSPLPQVILSSVQRCVERTLMRRGEETLPDSFKTPDRSSLLHNEGRKRHGPHVWQCPDANLAKCLPVMQLGNCPIKEAHAGCSGFVIQQTNEMAGKTKHKHGGKTNQFSSCLRSIMLQLTSWVQQMIVNEKIVAFFPQSPPFPPSSPKIKK